MQKLTAGDLLSLEQYSRQRPAFRERLLAHKRDRRLAIGPSMMWLFEDRLTVQYQIQEMLRAERITDLDAVRAELAVYNALLPEFGQLSATLLIEITEHENIAERLLTFLGIDECVALDVGGERVAAVFEEGRSREDKLSAVQYLRFALPASARRAFADAAVPARLVVEHPHYRHAVELTGDVRASLSEDLRGDA